MKYLAMAIVLMTITSSAFAESIAVSIYASAITSNDKGLYGNRKNISEAQDREDIIKANLDEKSDSKEASEQKSEE